jgi:hypothetical protein
MSAEFDAIALYRQLRTIHEFLITKLWHDTSSTTPRAGWHNTFAQRIGSTGSAVPLLFIEESARWNGTVALFQHRDAVLNAILDTQKQSGADNGGWSILSLSNVAIVEATAWCLQALARAGDVRSRGAIVAAEAWLIANQDPSGGWGPNKGNAPRTLTTDLALNALSELRPKNRKVVADGVTWLLKHQRRDGSWGEYPGQDGSLYHTAGVVYALCKNALLSLSDSHIVRATSWIMDNWTPTASNRWITETYEVHHAGAYGKVPLTHDVHAAVIRALLAARDYRAWERIGRGISIISVDYRNGDVVPRGIVPSIWNVIPAGLAILEFLESHPTPSSGRAYLCRDVAVFQTNSARSTRLTLTAALVGTFQVSLRATLILLAAVVAAILFVLFMRGTLEAKELLVSLAVEIVSIGIGLVVERRMR